MDSNEYAYKKIRENSKHYKSNRCETCMGGDCGECSYNSENNE